MFNTSSGVNPNESIGIIFRENGSIGHSKGINKILLYDDNLFFTSGRDSIIKLWNNNKKEKCYDILCNYEHHVDWVNDLAIAKPLGLLFSCSNDKTINIWNLNNDKQTTKDYIVSPTYHIHELHRDYVKALCYNENSRILYSCGFDGFISMLNIEEIRSLNRIFLSNEHLLANTNNCSIFSIDCDMTGKNILASVYENQIIGYDTRQRKQTCHLRGHKGIVRALKLSPDGKIAISVSSDRTVKVWDMFTHKTLKSWEFHSDSVMSLAVNETFTKIITGSNNGEIFLTDLVRCCYCKVDSLTTNESIISLSINQKNEIMASTNKGNLLEYSYKTQFKKMSSNETNLNGTRKENLPNVAFGSIQKNSRIDNSKSLFEITIADFSPSEIVSFHLMKNKNYIVAQTRKKEICIFNVLKMKKIFENATISYEKLIENLEPYDKVTLKSWFNADIKLGCLSIILTPDSLYNSTMNFNNDYLENIIERRGIYGTVISGLSFLLDESNTTTSFASNAMVTNQSLIKSASGAMSDSKKSSNDKENTCGSNLMKTIFMPYVQQSLERIKEFIYQHFYDSRSYLYKAYRIELLDTSKRLASSETKSSSYFVFSVVGNRVSIGPYINEISSSFNIPTFIHNDFQISLMNIDPPNISGKIELRIDNRRKEFKTAKNKETETIEAPGTVTILKLKEWIVSSYIDSEYLKSKAIKPDLKSCNFNESQTKYILDTYVADTAFLHNFVDLYVFTGISLKPSSLTIVHFKQLFFEDNTIPTVQLRYSPINTLIDRNVIVFPKE